MDKHNSERRLLHDGLSRREFVGATAGVAIGGLVAGPWSLKPVKAAEPKKGGAALIGLNGASSSHSLDPGKMITSYTYTSSRALRNNLTEIAPDGSLIPELAESWEPSKDLTSWTFRLRKGVEFHNGKTLTATDVVASVNHHRGPDSR